MVFIIDLIKDSNVLNSLEDFNEMTPEECYNKYGEKYLYNIISNFFIDYTNLEKMYSGDYNFTNEDLLSLINQLSYINNKHLVEIIVFAKYKKSKLIEDNLNEDLSK